MASARVLFDFNAEDDGELSVRAGEVVTVLDASSASADGWVQVRARGGEGFVPADFLEVAAPPAPAPAPAPAAASGGLFGAAGLSAAASYTAAPAPAPVPAPAPLPASVPSVGRYLGAAAAAPPVPAPAPAAVAAPRVTAALGSPVLGDSLAAASAASTGVAASSSSSASSIPVAALPEYSALFASHEEWFRAASSKRQEVYRTLQGDAMDILRALAEAEGRSASLLQRIGELDGLISQERDRWQQKLAEEAHVVAASPALASYAFRG